jgi:hypothetical protein
MDSNPKNEKQKINAEPFKVNLWLPSKQKKISFVVDSAYRNSSLENIVTNLLDESKTDDKTVKESITIFREYIRGGNPPGTYRIDMPGYRYGIKKTEIANRYINAVNDTLDIQISQLHRM